MSLDLPREIFQQGGGTNALHPINHCSWNHRVGKYTKKQPVKYADFININHDQDRGTKNFNELLL